MRHSPPPVAVGRERDTSVCAGIALLVCQPSFVLPPNLLMAGFLLEIMEFYRHAKNL
ncbi:hypothetical protein KE003_004002 [Acinetobacter baumannii]|uniref:hypothetical protein n=1 Tax=Acinetobacter baumannii TaxID=470 RepID=UPI0002CEDB65|nr:hypothetical protein F978_03812 [Acinetobacter baumannii NIPH 615]ENV27844.1 hypothetical protein F961_03847 [Acinetobacter baumannii NIPH 60]